MTGKEYDIYNVEELDVLFPTILSCCYYSLGIYSVVTIIIKVTDMNT